MKLFVRPTLTVATVIYLITLIPSIILAPFSIFLYGPSDNNFILHAFATLWLIFPVSLIVAILGSWLSNVYNKTKPGKFINFFLLLPIIHSVLLVIFGILHFAS